MKHEYFITHINNEEDVVYLRSKLLPVNMRLFGTSQLYRAIVLSCCDYIKWLCTQKMEGYKKPHGMSGANAAIPFNIIAYCVNRGKGNEYAQIMINPIIVDRSEGMVDALSNCGSIVLDEPISIKRYRVVTVEYYDENGIKLRSTFHSDNYGKTIQHEIDHNLGILITDRV